MRRTKEEAAETRTRLLEAALEIFHARGYAATTLEEIARQAGITRGAIQWHFGNKAELYNTLVRERYQEAAEIFRDLYENEKTPLQTLRGVLVRWLSYTEENERFRMMLELVMLKTEMSPELASGIEEKAQGNRITLQFFTKMIQQGIDSGEIRAEVNPEVAALAALGLINGLVTLWLFDPTAFSLRATAAESVDMFLRGLARP